MFCCFSLVTTSNTVTHTSLARTDHLGPLTCKKSKKGSLLCAWKQSTGTFQCRKTDNKHVNKYNYFSNNKYCEDIEQDTITENNTIEVKAILRMVVKEDFYEEVTFLMKFK